MTETEQLIVVIKELIQSQQAQTQAINYLADSNMHIVDLIASQEIDNPDNKATIYMDGTEIEDI